MPLPVSLTCSKAEFLRFKRFIAAIVYAYEVLAVLQKRWIEVYVVCPPLGTGDYNTVKLSVPKLDIKFKTAFQTLFSVP